MKLKVGGGPVFFFVEMMEHNADKSKKFKKNFFKQGQIISTCI